MKKKHVWIIAIIVVLAIIGVIVTTNQKSDEEKLMEYTEGTDKYAGISHEYVVSPSVSQEAKGMIEIKYEIDQGLLDLEILAVGLTLHNTSNDRIIEEVWVSMKVLDDKNTVLLENKKLLSYEVIGPGEADKSPYLFKAHLEYLDSPSKFVITLEKVDLAGTSVTAPAPPTPSPSVVTDGLPGEVVIAFFEATKKGLYSEAEQYLSSDSLIDLDEAKKSLESNPQVVIEKVEILDERIHEDGTTAVVIFKVYLSNGDIEEITFDMVKEDGNWKI